MKISFVTHFLFPALVAVLVAGCYNSTFRIEKDNINGYFGRDQDSLNTMLCDQGDLKVILTDADLPENIQKDFYTYVCTDQRSYDKVTSLYLFLTPEQKTQFLNAFRRHGYLINAPRCCG